jgi:hypothetical protein
METETITNEWGQNIAIVAFSVVITTTSSFFAFALFIKKK